MSTEPSTSQTSPDGPEENKKNASFFSGQRVKYIALGLSVAVVVFLSWRSVYMMNQRELQTRREGDKKRAFNAALRDTPARRFVTTEGGPEGTRKAEIAQNF